MTAQQKNKELGYLENHINWEKVLKINNTSIYDETIAPEDDLIRSDMIAELLGLNKLGYGGCRVTLELNGYAIKIPLQHLGKTENEIEIESWKVLPSFSRQYFLPCLGGDQYATIYPIATLIDKFNHEWSDKAGKIIDKLENKGFDMCDCDSERFDQWGLLETKLVILDYGSIGFHFQS